MIKKILLTLFLFLLSLVFAKPGFAIAVSGGYSDNENSSVNNFSASTLYFFLTDINDNPINSSLFDFSGMQPGLSLNKTVRIIKKGQEDFKYNINFYKNSGDDNLCKALQIEAKTGGVTKYNGNLSEFSLASSVAIGQTGVDDWDFKISLSDDNSDLKNKNCSFNLTFHGFQLDSNGSWGFSDSHSLSNTISTIAWENPESLATTDENLQTDGLTTDEQTNNLNVQNDTDLPRLEDQQPTSESTLTPTPDIVSPDENSSNEDSNQTNPPDNNSSQTQNDEALPPETSQ